jgi:hypothetical protein
MDHGRNTNGVGPGAVMAGTDCMKLEIEHVGLMQLMFAGHVACDGHVHNKIIECGRSRIFALLRAFSHSMEEAGAYRPHVLRHGLRLVKPGSLASLV